MRPTRLPTFFRALELAEHPEAAGVGFRLVILGDEAGAMAPACLSSCTCARA